jgi:FAD/FMN-containing dehydrogenase
MDRRTFNRSLMGAVALAPFASQLAQAASAAKAGRVSADVDAISTTGEQLTLPKAAVKDFQNSLHGQLILPGYDNYDAVRSVWNGMIDKRPGIIARCAGASDVLTSVNFARANNLLVAVRGGGHSISGKSVCEGGLLIDLQPMRWARADPTSKTAVLGAGALLADLDNESQAFGLATTAGTVSHTGAAGLTLGGGHGRLARRFGLTADNVNAFDMVTADGQFLHVTADENPDLYWGLRGGGGNFGIVTAFEYQLHEIGTEVLSGTLMYPLSQAREVLANYAEFAANAPNELAVDLIILSPPGRKPILLLSSCYSGDFAEGERLLAPLRAFGKPMVNQLAPKKYIDVQTSADGSTPPGKQYYNKSGLMTELSAGAIDAIVSRMEEASGQADPGVATNVIIQHLGGVMGDKAPDATAYAHRDARHDCLLLSAWTDTSYNKQNSQWLRDAFTSIEPFTMAAYSNHLVDSDTQQQSRTFRGNYDRLVELKNQYDPENFFRLNANIKPTV